MPATVRRIPNEPILVATLSGALDAREIEEMFRQSAALIQGEEGRIFRITDVRDANSTFAEMMSIIQTASKGQPGSTTDPRIRAVFVGNNHWVAMFRSALHLKQFGNVNIPMFLTEQDALDYIQMELEKPE